MKFQLLILVLFVFFIIVTTNNYNNEYFDARVSDIKIEQCGKICTDVYDCEGFGYDNTTSKCYISKTPIINLPAASSLYVDEYESKQYRCNKIKPIKLDQRNTDPTILRDNQLYMCADDDRGYYDLYKIVNNTMEKINRGDIDKVNLEPYVMNEIEWPTKEFKKDITPNLKTANQNRKIYTLFEKDKREFLGQFLFPYKCVSNVSEDECINQCRRYDDCIGTEWNPLYVNNNIINKNVCCPKKDITEIIDRRDLVENGNFYVKKSTNLLDPNDMYINIVHKK